MRFMADIGFDCDGIPAAYDCADLRSVEEEGRRMRPNDYFFLCLPLTQTDVPSSHGVCECFLCLSQCHHKYLTLGLSVCRWAVVFVRSK